MLYEVITKSVHLVILVIFSRIIELFFIGAELAPGTDTGQGHDVVAVAVEEIAESPVGLLALPREAEGALRIADDIV